MKRSRFLFVGIVAILVGTGLRAWPLLQSPLPFNPDGIVYAGLTSATVDTGAFPLRRMAVDELQFTAFLSVLELITGSRALYIAQPAIIVVGVLPVTIAVSTARRITPMKASWQRTAGVLAGILLAVEGLYLHRSMAVDEQTIGLFLVPLLAYAIARSREDQRWLLCLGIFLLVLPATHNLDAVIAGLLLIVAAGLYVARGTSLRKGGVLLGGAVAYWLYLGGYMIGLARITPAEIVQSARITDAPGLLLAWIVLAAVGGAWFVNRSARTQRTALFTVLSGWFVLLVLNAVTPVFPGMPTTNTVILWGVGFLVLPMGAAVYGVPLASEPRFGVPFLAQMAAVGTIVGVALTAALTPDYLNTLYRSQTFIHLPVLVFAALGTVAIAQRLGFQSGSWGVRVLSLVVVVSAAVSIPVAYGGLDVVPYKGVTTEAEFSASSFAVEYVSSEWASDDHLSRITRYYGPNRSVSMLPVYSWMHDGAPPPSCPVLSQHSWMTTGGQFYPKSPETVSKDVYEQFRVTRNVVYAGGRVDTLILSTPQQQNTPGC